MGELADLPDQEEDDGDREEEGGLDAGQSEAEAEEGGEQLDRVEAGGLQELLGQADTTGSELDKVQEVGT